MPKIGPTRTIKELQASARHTFHGKGRRGLPGVKTDSKVVDRNAHAQNGELGKRISNAVHALNTLSILRSVSHRSARRGPSAIRCKA